VIGGAGAIPGLSRFARASEGWGDYPVFAADALIPAEKRAKNVLEIFMYGGVSPWETFYVVDKDEYGKSQGYMWWTFQEGTNNVSSAYTNCNGAGAPPMLQSFATDENGAVVKLGPFMEPLRSRTDITERLRLHILSHTLEPHEGAIPLAMSGYRLGAPKLAGIGAAVQHYALSHDTEYTGEPYAYVLYSPGDFPTDNLRAASAIGLHPGSSRPLGIRVTPSTAFIEALQRKTVGELRPQFDALVNYYADEYKKQLSWKGVGSAVRSNTMLDYAFSIDTIQKTDTLVEILGEEFFEGVAGDACGQSAGVNYPHMNLKLAAHLLTRPGSKAKHITVVDIGLIQASGGGGYDTHSGHIKDSARNLHNLWTQLISIINEPGESDPSKLNLDETLIVLNTEFGRTPWSQGGSGRNHHPYAYVTAMFGGPVGVEQKGIVGGISSDGYASSALSPAETRAATLAALGIYPFAPECYAVSDVAGVTTEEDAAMWVKEVVLGVKS
jgi:hypothetical protein